MSHILLYWERENFVSATYAVRWQSVWQPSPPDGPRLVAGTWSVARVVVVDSSEWNALSTANEKRETFERNVIIYFADDQRKLRHGVDDGPCATVGLCRWRYRRRSTRSTSCAPADDGDDDAARSIDVLCYDRSGTGGACTVVRGGVHPFAVVFYPDSESFALFRSNRLRETWTTNTKYDITMQNFSLFNRRRWEREFFSDQNQIWAGRGPWFSPWRPCPARGFRHWSFTAVGRKP